MLKGSRMGKPGKPNTKPNTGDPLQYINLLFLGETGVGKSTFINAFVNYLSFDTLKLSKNGKPVILIPSKFVITDENLQEREIEFGNDKNENKMVGESATQESKCYVFSLQGNKHLLRLIDTPGIGDTRGIDQDKINCDNILAMLGKYDDLHGICILLKPNNARVTAQFSFCINQLLTHLEKSASKNIVFVFTNSRSTFYRPGDTLPALRKILTDISKKPPYVNIELSEKNTFCLDNEAFRFLMAVQKEIKFKDDEEQQFSLSWDASRKTACK